MDGANVESVLVGSRLLVIRGISVGVSLCITVINHLLKAILRYFTRLECHASQTEFNSSFLWKSVVVVGSDIGPVRQLLSANHPGP